ncbi:MAG: hypothetical protein K0S08_398 [Gammaproteobacteria bacterium]|jgi:hypothetical protein|nr:hypothetical protein [Gammaproteobacteria bacterium]
MFFPKAIKQAANWAYQHPAQAAAAIGGSIAIISLSIAYANYLSNISQNLQETSAITSGRCYQYYIDWVCKMTNEQQGLYTIDFRNALKNKDALIQLTEHVCAFAAKTIESMPKVAKETCKEWLRTQDIAFGMS